MPPPVFVNVFPSPVGSKMMPVTVRYGCSLSTTVGLTTVVVAVMSSRTLLVRYCAAVTATTSGAGLMVTVVTCGAEFAFPVLVATTLRVTTDDAVPADSAGAVKVTVAVLGPVARVVTPMSAGVPVCVTLNTRLCAGTFGSVPLRRMLPAAPANTVIGGIGLTVGVPDGPTVIVATAVAVPQALLTASVAVTGETAPSALKAGFAMVELERDPLVTVQA